MTSLIIELGLEQHAVLVGSKPQNELARELSSCSIFVNPEGLERDKEELGWPHSV